MAISLVQKITGIKDVEAGTSFTLTLDSAPIENNVLFAFITRNYDATITGPAGWTEVDDRADDASSSRHGVYWKVVGGSEPQAHAWTGTTAKWAGCIYELSGVDTSTPVDGSPAFGTGNSTTPTSPTFTPSTSGVMVLAGAGNNNWLTSFIPDVSLDNVWNKLTSASGAVAAGGGTDLRADTSATGTYTHTISSAQEWVAYTIGAKPSAVPNELDAVSAAFTVTASTVELERDTQINAASATFAVSGANVTLTPDVNNIQLIQTVADTVNSTDFTLTLPNAPIEDNVLFAVITKDGDGAITEASGWTEVDDRADINSGSRHGLYWKVVVASEPQAHTWSSNLEKWAGCIYELSNVDTSNPVDGTPVFNTAENATPISPTFTPTIPGTMVMAGCGCYNFVTVTPDSSLDFVWNQTSTATGACAAGGGLDFRQDTTATGTYTHSLSGSQGWVAYTFAATPGTGSPTLYADPAEFTVAGADVELLTPRIDAESASFTVTGSEVTLSVPFGWWRTPWWGDEWWQAPWWGQIDASRELPADSATYTVSGSDVDLNNGFTLPAASATFTVTGTAVGLEHGRQVDADPAAFTVTGSDVTFNYYNLPVDSATFTVTGNDDVELFITPLISYSLPVDNATFTVTGSDVELDRGYILAAATATFTVTGTVVDLEVDNELPALRATVTVSASDVSLYAPSLSKIDADPASFSVSASDITFSKDAIAVTFGQYDKTNIIKPEPHGVRISPEGEGFFFR